MRTRLLLPLSFVLLIILVAACTLAWPRTPAYGSTQAVTVLASQLQANPRAWLGRRVSVRGRIVSLFGGNMPVSTDCAPVGNGPVRALAGADGVPILLLGLAGPPSSWLTGVLDAIPAMHGALKRPLTWPASGSWQELQGRLVAAPQCVAAGPNTLYLDVEQVRASAQ